MIAHRDFTFNLARPGTLALLDHILEEVAGLFPDAGVIHFGGDEVHFGWGRWKELPEVRSLMGKEGLSELSEVESWFNRRMADKINRLGFVTGGWHEIAAKGLPQAGTLVFLGGVTTGHRSCVVRSTTATRSCSAPGGRSISISSSTNPIGSADAGEASIRWIKSMPFLSRAWNSKEAGIGFYDPYRPSPKVKR